MIVFPHCKINLGLSVVAKRADGYHNLETLFYPVPLCDALEVIENTDAPANTIQLITYGLAVEGPVESNLIYKAYKMLAETYTLPSLTFCLNKHIPMGAGLGGGSADGAFALRLINKFCNLNLDRNTLISYASRMGSDCAFFIEDKPCLGSGRGEILEPVDFSLRGWYLVMVKPPVHISTADAFRGIRPASPAYTLKDLIKQTTDTWKNTLVNDFEQSVFPQHPQLAAIKEKLYRAGAVYAAMSGSGSTLFGLFRFEPKLQTQFTGNFYWEGQL